MAVGNRPGEVCRATREIGFAPGKPCAVTSRDFAPPCPGWASSEAPPGRVSRTSIACATGTLDALHGSSCRKKNARRSAGLVVQCVKCRQGIAPNFCADVPTDSLTLAGWLRPAHGAAAGGILAALAVGRLTRRTRNRASGAGIGGRRGTRSARAAGVAAAASTRVMFATADRHRTGLGRLPVPIPFLRAAAHRGALLLRIEIVPDRPGIYPFGVGAG